MYSFLQENKGKTFTVRALKQKLDPMNDRELGSFLQNILNKMRDNDIIESALHDGETHYYFPEIFTSTKYDYTESRQPEIFDSGQGQQISRKKTKADNTSLIAVAIIGSIIGFMLIIFAKPTIFIGDPSTGITMIIIGIIVITIVSRGRCFFLCL